MPIKPENRKRYPANWKDIRKDILKRADNKCEFCGIENYAIRENGSKVVLTIAHLDHTPEIAITVISERYARDATTDMMQNTGQISLPLDRMV